MCVGVAGGIHVCRPKEDMTTLLYHFPPYSLEAESLTEPTASGSPTDLPVPSALHFLGYSCTCMLQLTCVLGIDIFVLIFGWFYPLTHFPAP